MSEFTHFGIKVVVNVTEQAKFDFDSWQIAESVRSSIARNLKAMPRSPRDRLNGQLRVREIGDWDVFFTFSFDEQPTIIIVAVEPKGAIETAFDYIRRVGTAALPRSVQELLKGRRRKGE